MCVEVFKLPSGRRGVHLLVRPSVPSGKCLVRHQITAKRGSSILSTVNYDEKSHDYGKWKIKIQSKEEYYPPFIHSSSLSPFLKG